MAAFPHWQFWRGRDLILQYWPSAQRARSDDGLTIEGIPGPHEALLCARQMLGECDRTIAEIRGAREALKNPLETLPVFWAGEATAPAYRPHYQPLSVHGAFISGMTVAQDVAWYLNNPGQDFAQFYRQKYNV